MSTYLAEARYPLELAPAMPDVWELWQRAKTLEWDPEMDIPWAELHPERYTEEQIIGFLREADAGLPIKELGRKHGFIEPSYYAWKAKFGGMKVSDAQRLKALEAENGKLKRLLANSMLEVDAMREVLQRK